MEFNDSLLIKHTDDLKLPGTGTVHRQQMTLHCQQCNAVLADSTGVCGEMESMDSLMCLRVTNDVVISDKMESGHKGEMTNCIYSSLKCRGCRCALGKVIHSAPSRLALIRSIFLLYKANINCYILNSSSLVKASTLTFDQTRLRESMNEFFSSTEEASRMRGETSSSNSRSPDAFLSKLLNHVRRQFEAQLEQMSRIKNRLVDRSVTSSMVN